MTFVYNHMIAVWIMDTYYLIPDSHDIHIGTLADGKVIEMDMHTLLPR